MEKCSPCSSKCQTCKDHADYCLTCVAPRENPPNCHCPVGNYDNGNVCVACAYNCHTCTDREVCTSCSDIRV